MERILLINDDVSVFEKLDGLLRSEFILITVPDYYEALGLLRKDSISLILLYCQGPILPVLESMKKIIEFSPNQTIIMVGDTHNPDFHEQFINAGGYDSVSFSSPAPQIRHILQKAAERQKLVEKASVYKHRISLSEPKQNGAGIRAEPSAVSRMRKKYMPGGREYFYQTTLRRLCRVAADIFDLDRICERILAAVLEPFGITRGALLLKTGRGEYVINASRGLSKEKAGLIKLGADDALVKWLGNNLQMLKWDTVLENLHYEGFVQLKKDMEFLNARLVVPLVSEGGMTGILSLHNKMSGIDFTDDEMELLTVIAGYGAVIIENAVQYEKVDHQRRDTTDILAHLNGGVIVVDTQATIKVFNRAAANILQKRSEDVVGMKVEVLDKNLAGLIRSCLSEGKIYTRQEITTANKDMVLGVSVCHLKNKHGKTTGVIVTFANLSVHKQLEEEKKRIEQLSFWSELTIRMAQEIKNPLVPIRTFTQLLPQKYDDPEFRKDFYEVVSGEINRLDALIEQLVSFACPGKPEHQRVDVNDILEEVFLSLNEKMEKQNIRLNRHLEGNLPRILVDQRQIERIFYNLCLNAVQAMPEGGELSVTTALKKHYHLNPDRDKSGDYLEIEFKDTGTGILKEKMDRIFDPFYTTRIKGAGLGLSIARRIAEGHKGSIEAYSQNGAGSVFNVLLPTDAPVNGKEGDDIEISSGR